MLLDHLSAKLRTLEAQSLTRFLRQAESGTAPRQQVRGADGRTRELLMFCSNDYLGLAAEPALRAALIEGAQIYGGGSGASPLISGHSRAHEQVAETLGRWLTPHIPEARALGFCTGYMANLAVVTALGDEEAEIFSEAWNHASLIDGTRLARAQVKRYAHGDVAALRELLTASTAKVKLIVTDAVFSMDGDLAPLPALLALAEEFDAWLIVDDARYGITGFCIAEEVMVLDDGEIRIDLSAGLDAVRVDATLDRGPDGESIAFSGTIPVSLTDGILYRGPITDADGIEHEIDLVLGYGVGC